MSQKLRDSRSIKTTIRLNPAEHREIIEAAKVRGYTSPSAFLRSAIQNELKGKNTHQAPDDRIAASFDRVSRGVFRVGRGQQALFALIDTLTKTFLTCVPEPQPEVKRQAIARARDRYDAFMKTAGQAMVGDARAAMLDLVDRVSADDPQG